MGKNEEGRGRGMRMKEDEDEETYMPEYCLTLTPYRVRGSLKFCSHRLSSDPVHKGLTSPCIARCSLFD